MNQPIADSFESDFLAQPLEGQIALCDRYELAPLFSRLFAGHQPVLEAGCGSGRWCAWFHQRGIRSDGVDWSRELCERAGRLMPYSRFTACDMAAMPLPDASYEGILALGSIEHSREGPEKILREFHRLLVPGGVALITVPFGGGTRALLRPLKDRFFSLKACGAIRKILGRGVPGATLREARKTANPDWNPRFSHGSEGWFFFEYQFTKAHMRAFLSEAGFAVREEFAAFGDEGVLHNFGRLAGRWNEELSRVDLTPAGRLLRAMLPVRVMGHMLCYVAEKARS